MKKVLFLMMAFMIPLWAESLTILSTAFELDKVQLFSTHLIQAIILLK
jgi:hypothetical protein